jgi:aclacinomycin oxidase
VPGSASRGDAQPGAQRFTPGSPTYEAIVDRRFNKRFRAHPDYVQSVRSTEQIVQALDAAVAEGRRVAATSGGHCLENFVSSDAVRVILDVSPLDRIYFDDERGAVAVEAGATVGQTYRTLFDSWGVVAPLGEYPGIGMGGHVAGGAFGFLCRQLGLACDYLHAVEVVTVDATGRAGVVVATCDPSDPHHDLWWAHTGGGGGNFGIVTRYWFRAPGATGSEPTDILPRAPDSVATVKAEWPWEQIDRRGFARLLDQFGRWCAQHSDPGVPEASLWALFAAPRQPAGPIVIRGVSVAGASAAAQFDAFLQSIGEGVAPPSVREERHLGWLEFALDPLPDLFAAPPGGVSMKIKDALLRRPLADRQIDVAFDYLTSPDHDVMGGMLGLATYGGRVNAVPPHETATSQRSAIIDLACNAGWLDPKDEAKNLAWVRGFYQRLFSDTGGVPVPGEAYEGAFINHPDSDLADPAFNTSGVPWHTLYFKANYPRLQRVKTRWDPLDVFRHALAVRPA